MSNLERPDFIITIRSAGERTERICYQTVQKQAPAAEIVIIHKKPFKKALEECFKKGIQSSKKWLITVDADMILFPGAIDLLLREAEKMPPHYLQLQGKILDKITGNIRKAGPRIYRVSSLPMLLKKSKSLEDHIRPESRIISEFANDGKPSRYIAVVTCLHDYEQYFKDVYRKAYVHAVKHPEFLPKMIEESSERQVEDYDYKVILKALWDGLTDNAKISIDTRLFTDSSKEALEYLQLEEKKELGGELTIKNFVETGNYVCPNEVLKENKFNYHDQPKQSIGTVKRIKNSVIRRGLYNSLRRYAGNILISTGKRIHG